MKKLPSKLQGILEFLGDGKFHELDELQEGTGLSEKQAKEVLAFLAEYGFVLLNRDQSKVRVTQGTKRLLAQTATC